MSHYIPQKQCMWLLIHILKYKRGRWNKILFMFIIGSKHKVRRDKRLLKHYGDVIMGAIASRITSLTIVYPTVCSDADQRKHQSSVSLGTGEFPAQMASNADFFSIWWRHHESRTALNINQEENVPLLEHCNFADICTRVNGGRYRLLFMLFI